MTKVYMKRAGTNLLVPASEPDREVIDSLPYGMEFECDIKQKRNYRFHKKFMALLRIGYAYYEPEPINGVTPKKDFEVFRDWAVIHAGHYEVIGLPDGSVTLKAKSISFAKMDEAGFHQLYSRMIDVMLEFLGKYGFNQGELERVERDVLMFDA